MREYVMLVPRGRVFHTERKQLLWRLLDGSMPDVTGNSEEAAVVETLWTRNRVVGDEVTEFTVGQIMGWIM